MIDALVDLPSHLRERLASGLESGLVGAPYSATSVRSVLGHRDGIEDVATALQELERLGVTERAAGAFIRAIGRVGSRAQSPDLVWSGPEVSGLHARDTRRVYEELLGSAERSVWAPPMEYVDRGVSERQLSGSRA